MARDSTQQRAPKKSGTGAAVAAVGIVVVLVAIVMLGIMATKNKRATEVEPVVVEKRDPFAGLERETAVVRKAPEARGFSGKSFESESKEWTEAREIQARAAELHAQSGTLRNAGKSEWRDVGKQAKALYEEAIEKGDAYRAVYAGEFGETYAGTKRLDKTLHIWKRDLMGLHKTVGA